MSLKILIVDDEPPARRKLAAFVNRIAPDSHIAEAGDGVEAREKIVSDRFDMLFLDIQMPRMTGLQLIEALTVENLPPTVFVTAYHEYAIQAFELEAVDYLLKPYDEERFRKAFERVRNKVLAEPEARHRLQRLMDIMGTPERPIDRFIVKVGNRRLIVPAAEVCYVAAEGKYARLHLAQKSYLISRPLRELESLLNPAKYVRIHRSWIINLDFLKEMQPQGHGDSLLLLTNGAQLTLSRRYRENFLQRFAT